MRLETRAFEIQPGMRSLMAACLKNATFVRPPTADERDAMDRMARLLIDPRVSFSLTCPVETDASNLG